MDRSLYEKITDQIQEQSELDGTRRSLTHEGTKVTVTHYDKGRFHIAFECDEHALPTVAEGLPLLERELKSALPYQIRLDRPRRKTVAKIDDSDHR